MILVSVCFFLVHDQTVNDVSYEARLKLEPLMIDTQVVQTSTFVHINISAKQHQTQ